MSPAETDSTLSVCTGIHETRIAKLRRTLESGEAKIHQSASKFTTNEFELILKTGVAEIQIADNDGIFQRDGDCNFACMRRSQVHEVLSWNRARGSLFATLLAICRQCGE